MYFQVDGSNLRIAGTMHIFPAEFPDVPDWLWQAYYWCEHLIIESNQSDILPHRPLPSGSSLRSIIGAETFETVAKHWPANGDALDNLKPWAAFLGLPGALLPQVPGVEIQLLERIRADLKPVFTLESAESLARLLETVPDNVYADRLAFMASDPNFIRSAIRALHRAWLSRDLAAVLSLVAQLPVWQSPILREPFVDARNRSWMPRIREAIQSEHRTLILVGALHLCGEGSVLKLTEQEGHRLSALE